MIEESIDEEAKEEASLTESVEQAPVALGEGRHRAAPAAADHSHPLISVVVAERDRRVSLDDVAQMVFEDQKYDNVELIVTAWKHEPECANVKGI